MMDLHQEIDRLEFKEVPRFDFLTGVTKLVVRMDEVHPSDDNDAHFIFLIWVKPENHARVEKAIRTNLKKFGDQDWADKILPDTGEGLIVISTWL